MKFSTLKFECSKNILAIKLPLVRKHLGVGNFSNHF